MKSFKNSGKLPEKLLVVTTEADGSKPRIRFCAREDQAQSFVRKNLDAGRQAYIATIQDRFLTSRQFVMEARQ